MRREETGVKSFVDGQFSGLIEAVPIKKRRHPLIPTLCGEQGSLSQENESLEREQHSSAPQGSSVSNASVGDVPIKKRRLPSVQPEENNSSASCDTNKNPAFEEKNATSDVTDASFAQSNSNYVSPPNVEEPDLATRSRALDDAHSRNKLIASESCDGKSRTQVKKENSEHFFVAKESLALNIGSKICEQGVEEKYEQESRANTNLSLGLREHLSPAVTSRDIGGSFQKTEKTESVSLNLSLSKEEGSSKSSNDDAKTNRANWDLNTTMDAWEEPGSDDTPGKTSTSGSGLRIAGSAPSDKNIVCSTASLKHGITENLNKAFMISSGLYGRAYKYVDPGNLCFASCLPKFTEDPSRISVKQKSDCATPILSLSNVPASAVDVSKTSFRTVKSEPLDENMKQDLKEANPSVVRSLDDGVTVKHELVERSCVESIDNHKENCASKDEVCIGEKTYLGDFPGDQLVHSETVAKAMVDNVEPSGPAMKDCARGNEGNANDYEGYRLKLMNELPFDPQCSGEDGVSDDEKITLSADTLEDDCFGYDYESDGTHSLTVAMDVEQHGEEDDDYEDGEVREPLKHSEAEKPVCEVKEVEQIVSSSCDDENNIEKEVLCGDCTTTSRMEEYDNRTVTRSKINCGKDGTDNESFNMSDNVTDKTVCIQESLEAERSTIVPQRSLLENSERNNVINAPEIKLSSHQSNDGKNEVDVAQCSEEVVKNLDMIRKTDSDLPKMEESVNIDDANKDVSSGCHQGRIINLAQAASSLSPTKSRSIPGRGLPSQAERDAIPDLFHHEKLHGGRDDVYFDGPYKFSRERHQDISPRNSRPRFVRGRGRINSRIDSCQGEWKSDREFTGEFYNGPSHFRGSRHRFVSAVHDSESEYNNVAHDGSFVGNNRFGRKPLNEEGPVGRHIMRRRSPGVREMQMGQRYPRNMSPSRCSGDDGSEFVGMRHGEKFIRGYPEDTSEPMFSRSQPFERGDGRFTRGARNFIQRRGPPRIHSKSPTRSRTRSPGPWSSPRRRTPRGSPDGYNGNPELAHRRRVDRMRSPDGNLFSGERRGVRRHVSPLYMSRPYNDTRDFDSGRGRGHPRPGISNRGASGRILFRNRRFDGVDPQDRADNDEYFGGPMHSGRQFELNGEGNGDERRRYERRGPVRSFRPPYNGSVGENFDLDAEDGPRTYRFCPTDSEFPERNNLRERDFDRRMKNRPANMPPRRTRNIDEQETNYRNSGPEVWSDDSFDDISRMKRKRF